MVLLISWGGWRGSHPVSVPLFPRRSLCAEPPVPHWDCPDPIINYYINGSNPNIALKQDKSFTASIASSQNESSLDPSHPLRRH